MLERISTRQNNDYAVLIGVLLPQQTEQQTIEALQELEMLAQTAGVVCVKYYIQKLRRPHAKTFIGSGKLQEVKNYTVSRPDINMVIFDDDLSGSQFAAIEKVLNIKVIDRSTLILDIFAMHAKTAKAKTQVAIAQYKYLLPRLRGLWKHLERQEGGIGTRGPGETELETDRRIVKRKIARLAKMIKKIEQQGISQRKTRTGIMRVALSGYTNAGKTAIMNSLSKETFTSDDKLFVTLDTTTRKITTNTHAYLLSDTVGFIQKIPHHLIDSFKNTLEEVLQAHLILHVVDITHPNNKHHYQVVQQTLKEIGASHIPALIILNKLDALLSPQDTEILSDKEKELAIAETKELWEQHTSLPCLPLSAHTGENLNKLRRFIADRCAKWYAHSPY